MAEESSLDEALARIMATTPMTPAAAPGTALTTPVAPATPQTAVALGGTPPLAEPAPAYTAPVAAPVAPVAAPAAAAPVTATAAAPVYDRYNASKYVTGNFQQPATLSVGTAGGEYIPVTVANANDPQVKAQLERSLAQNQANLAYMPAGTGATATQASIDAMQAYMATPLTGAQWGAGQGLTPKAFRSKTPTEKQALKGQYQAYQAANPLV